MHPSVFAKPIFICDETQSDPVCGGPRISDIHDLSARDAESDERFLQHRPESPGFFLVPPRSITLPALHVHYEQFLGRIAVGTLDDDVSERPDRQ